MASYYKVAVICSFLLLPVRAFKICNRLISPKKILLSMSISESPKSAVDYYIRNVLSTTQAFLLVGLLKSLPAAATTTAAATTATFTTIAPTDVNKIPEVTDYVYFDVKIANYTEESVGKNRGANGSGRLILGLYGKDAPLSVARFLNVIDGDGESSPTFYDTIFSRIIGDELLDVEKVRGVNVVNIAGTDQYEYAGNVLADYQPILENNGIPHNRRGLLTRRQLSAGPEFGITMGPAADLDSFHVVFGEVVQGFGVLDAIATIPTYSYNTQTGYGGAEKGVESGLADQWFSSQRKFYVDMGKMMGDQRAVDLRGKLLRRVTIKGAGRLQRGTISFAGKEMPVAAVTTAKQVGPGKRELSTLRPLDSRCGVACSMCGDELCSKCQIGKGRGMSKVVCATCKNGLCSECTASASIKGRGDLVENLSIRNLNCRCGLQRTGACAYCLLQSV